MAKNNSNPDFLNGVPELAVLRVLADGPLHGYAIVQAITQRSAGQLQFGEGSIYPVLHRLEQSGLLNTRRESIGGRERIIYRISKKGTKQLTDSCARWYAISQSIKALIEGECHVRPSMVPATS